MNKIRLLKREVWGLCYDIERIEKTTEKDPKVLAKNVLELRHRLEEVESKVRQLQAA